MSYDPADPEDVPDWCLSPWLVPLVALALIATVACWVLAGGKP